MERALVVFETSENGQRILRIDFAAGVDARLDVLALTPEDLHKRVRGRREGRTRRQRAGGPRQPPPARRGRRWKRRDGLDVDWNAVAALVGDSETYRILQARSGDGPRVPHWQERSPTGKAVFGDRSQSIILNFDGPVTTLLG